MAIIQAIRARVALALAVTVAVLGITVAQTGQSAETEYFSDGGNLVAFYVYRVHNQVEMLENDNAASPGGEIGFLANEFAYQNGLISRDCVVMYNQTFSSYDCCNGGSCFNCGYSGSANGNANMPGRSYQLYPPPGAPASCNQNDACSGVPGVDCGGQCSGWWYSFQSQGACTNGQTPTANGCTWYNSPVVQVINFNTLLTSGSFFTCEQTAQNPSGGCNGYLGWTPFMQGVHTMLNMFSSSAYSMIFDPTTSTFVNTTVPAQADPASMCQAPCPAGSFSSSGYMTFGDQCQWCGAGTYAPFAASTACTPCPNGGTSPAGASAASQCSGGSAPADGGDADATTDGDADSGTFFGSDDGNSPSQVKGSNTLPLYGAVLIALASLVVVASAVVGTIKLVRSRRAEVLEDQVELSEKA